jgi:serine/threonine protein kinase
MAPEQTSADLLADIGPSTDVYALGGILYWLLTGTFIYNVDCPTEAALDIIRNTIPEPPSQRNPATPSRFDDIVLACLRKDPKTRPQTAGNLAALLRAAMANQPVKLPSDSPVGTAGPTSRNRLIPVLAIAAGLIALTIGLLAVLFPSLFGGSRSVATVPPPVIDRIPAEPTRQPPVVTTRPSTVVQTFSAAEISAISNQAPITNHQSPVPMELWGIYNRVKEELGKFEHARHGAVIVRPANTGVSTYFTYRIEGDPSSREQSIEPGGVAVLYLPADAKCNLECITNGNVIRKALLLSQGEITYIVL